jgi:hypothetical protein
MFEENSLGSQEGVRRTLAGSNRQVRVEAGSRQGAGRVQTGIGGRGECSGRAGVSSAWVTCDGQRVTGTCAVAGVKPARGVNNKNPQAGADVRSPSRIEGSGGARQ